MKITIDESVRQATGGRLALGVIQAKVTVSEHDAVLWKRIDQVTAAQAALPVASIAAIPEIAAQRETYLALGKKPQKYRGASEALLRRIVKGQGLYRVNTLVDINNLISITSKRVLGSYDLDHIDEAVHFSVGEEGEPYQGIGKGQLNIARLPVFRDSRGPFGSATSDSQRAMITLQTQRAMMVIMAFDGDLRLQTQMDEAADLLTQFCDARDVNLHIVR